MRATEQLAGQDFRGPADAGLALGVQGNGFEKAEMPAQGMGHARIRSAQRAGHFHLIGEAAARSPKTFRYAQPGQACRPQKLKYLMWEPALEFALGRAFGHAGRD